MLDHETIVIEKIDQIVASLNIIFSEILEDTYIEDNIQIHLDQLDRLQKEVEKISSIS